MNALFILLTKHTTAVFGLGSRTTLSLVVGCSVAVYPHERETNLDTGQQWKGIGLAI